ncbi:hypothetical protein BC834DRAFT_597900 [Gloeopeniophorella convolvens]|nr:hypothetical protein BC834DRAFT_597900 [Gloeopeniophorella convolvens]
MSPLSQQRACRKYVDLINEASGKWVNWNPVNSVQVGDYGKIDFDTGQLVVEGNIYRDEPLASTMKLYPPVSHAPIPEYKVDSSFSRYQMPPPEFEDLDDVALKAQWKFGERRAGFLVMYQARRTSIPEEFLKLTLKSPIPELKGKDIVTNIFTCPAFAMYMSNKSGENVKLALRTSVTETGTQSGWYAEGNVGVYQFGSLPDPEAFLPLYNMQVLQKRARIPRRDGRDPNELHWGATEAPWKDLNDEGEEEPSDEGEPWEDSDD